MPTTTPSPPRLPLDDAVSPALGEVLAAVALGVADVADLLTNTPAPAPADDASVTNASGDAQADLDRRAHDLFVAAAETAPILALASEEAEDPILITPGAPYALAIDPLDGSSNIAINAPIGTIFSVLDVAGTDPSVPDAAFLGDGARIVASGIALYGPRTSLVIAVEGKLLFFGRDPRSGRFQAESDPTKIPTRTNEYAINSSNYRFWPAPIRHYVDDLIAGADGPRGVDANTRWVAAVVADAFRILRRGGIYLYPRDRRASYSDGRLRLLYERHPIAYLIEAAGGAATDGIRRLLDVEVNEIHQRTPLVFGSADEVGRVAEYHETPFVGTQSPLFGQRGLFRG